MATRARRHRITVNSKNNSLWNMYHQKHYRAFQETPKTFVAAAPHQLTDTKPIQSANRFCWKHINSKCQFGNKSLQQPMKHLRFQTIGSAAAVKKQRNQHKRHINKQWILFQKRTNANVTSFLKLATIIETSPTATKSHRVGSRTKPTSQILSKKMFYPLYKTH